MREMNDNLSQFPATAGSFDVARHEMVVRQIQDRGIRQSQVLRAMEAVPRHLFVPSEFIPRAYEDEPQPIGKGQTISQPFMVAAMAQASSLAGNEHVLEIGAGSGYQAAILSLLARDVTAVETHAVLASAARNRLAALGYANVRIEEADGSLGWISGAPFDAILVTAAAPAVPPPLVDQLAEGGRLVIPVGTAEQQDLIRIVKKEGRITQASLYACRFVPLRGFFGWRENSQEPIHG
jgi:protein-L-isoaspartate(D-aspartate) O-methyltransferase